jgi:hypothetical protein
MSEENSAESNENQAAEGIDAGVGSEGVSAKPDIEPGSFLESIPEQFRDEPSLQKYKNQDDFLTSYLSLERYRGNSLPLPKEGEELSTDDRKALYEKVTRALPELADRIVPDSIDGYAMPEGASEELGVLREIAREAKLSTEQYNTVLETVMKGNELQTQQANEAREKEVYEHKQEWGPAYPDRYNEAYAMARSMSDINSDHLAFQDGTISPTAIKTYYQMAQMVKGKAAGLSEQGVISDRLTPAETREAIADINKKLESIKPSDPMYKELLAQRRKHYQALPENQETANPGYVGMGEGGVKFG